MLTMSMDISRYAVDCVILEGRSLRAVAKSVGRSKSWVANQVTRFKSGGYDALLPRSRAPLNHPIQTTPELGEEIVRLRKLLTELGTDGGANTILFHLRKTHTVVPSKATIYRILKRRGFVEDQPQKRPKNSWIRFESALPNECWQSDMTHWNLADGTKVEIISFIDDYSRMVVGSQVVDVARAPDVTALFYRAASRWGFPESVLSDNGCIFTAAYRGGRTGLETELCNLGIVFKHGKPYHPQTQGKIERFQKTLKRWLDKQPFARSIAQLQFQVDWFIRYYNEERPHSARGMVTPRSAWDKLDKAFPSAKGVKTTANTRVRHDVVDTTGSVSLRYSSKLYHIGIGRAHKGTRVIILIAGLDVRVISQNGELLRHLTFDPTKSYQPIGGS